LITDIILFNRLKDRSHKLLESSCKDNASWLFSTTGNAEGFKEPETTPLVKLQDIKFAVVKTYPLAKIDITS